MKKSIDICETVTLAVCQYIDPKINLAAGQRKNCLTLPVWNQGLLKSTPGISHHQFVWMSSKPLIGKLYNLHLAYQANSLSEGHQKSCTFCRIQCWCLQSKTKWALYAFPEYNIYLPVWDLILLDILLPFSPLQKAPHLEKITSVLPASRQTWGWYFFAFKFVFYITLVGRHFFLNCQIQTRWKPHALLWDVASQEILVDWQLEVAHENIKVSMSISVKYEEGR